MSSGSFPEDPSAVAGVLPTPAMPDVPADSLYRGMPRLLLDGHRHSLGWQVSGKSGPGFVVTRLSWPDRIKVRERFPLTEQGWESAWRTLSGLDSRAAEAIAKALAEQESGRRATAAVAALDHASQLWLRPVTFTGGSGGAPLAQGQDLRPAVPG